jgi:serine/threonine protein kinase
LIGYEQLVKHDIIHDDLKPENILIKDKYFKIADFGLSFRLNLNQK